MTSRYKKAVAFVESFSNISYRKCVSPEKKDLSFFLDRTRYFLKLIGNPEKDFRCVHITGTAGKGSVSSMVHEILLSAGKKAGLFTSPYVTTTIEKIKVNQKYIAPSQLVKIINYLKPFIKQAEESHFGTPSAFEIFTAVALLYFKEQKCEWAVMEVGLGGRYDATNAIPADKIAAITHIDYDHTEILGKTLKKIANDKAGIITQGCTFFTAEQRPSLVRLFKEICYQQHANFHSIGKQKDAEAYNRALATAIGSHLGFSQETIEKGLQNSRMPCRFETVQTKPLIILDGAHNRSKIRSTIAKLKNLKYNKLISIVSLANTKKDNLAIIEPLAKFSDRIIITSTSKTERRSIHPNALLPYVEKYKKKKASVQIISSPLKALSAAKRYAKTNDCILVSGSFFLAGELRKNWFPEEWVLKNRRSFNKT
jgi:dihydrofolate synthase/folylpolyglutamate synthase